MEDNIINPVLIDSTLESNSDDDKKKLTHKSFALVKEGDNYFVSNQETLRHALFSTANDKEPIKILDRVEGDGFRFGTVIEIGLDNIEATTMKSNLEKQKQIEKFKKQMPFSSRLCTRGGIYTSRIYRSLRRKSVASKLVHPTLSNIVRTKKTNKNVSGIKTTPNYSWMKKPTQTIWKFELNFKDANSIQDPLLINGLKEVARHFAPGNINGVPFDFAPDKNGLLKSIEDLKRHISDKVNVTSQNKGKSNINETSETTPIETSSDIDEYINDLLEGSVRPETILKEGSFLQDVPEPILHKGKPQSSEMLEILMAQETGVPESSSGGVNFDGKIFCLTDKYSSQIPTDESELSPESTVDQLQPIPVDCIDPTRKKRNIKKSYAGILPEIQNAISVSLNSQLIIDTYFKVTPGGLLAGARLYKGNDLPVSQNDIAKVIFISHPVFNSHIWSQMTPVNYDENEGKSVISVIKDYIRDCTFKFVRHTSTKIPGILVSKVDSNIFGNILNRKPKPNSKAFDRNLDVYTEVKKYSSWRLPRIAEEILTPESEVNLGYWLKVDHKEWDSYMPF